LKRQDVLVAYDVRTETADGRRRLRKVAKICSNYGQRVQLSVFECSVTGAQLEQLEYELTRIINSEQDSLRIYILHLGRENSVRIYGRDKYIDFDDPLVF
jgi:CRISPR-associated protein Cas2